MPITAWESRDPPQDCFHTPRTEARGMRRSRNGASSPFFSLPLPTVADILRFRYGCASYVENSSLEKTISIVMTLPRCKAMIAILPTPVVCLARCWGKICHPGLNLRVTMCLVSRLFLPIIMFWSRCKSANPVTRSSSIIDTTSHRKWQSFSV